MRARQLMTVNWHLEKHCNYSCKFCYAHFADVVGGLNEPEGRRLLDSLRAAGIYKINFAGGEPMLNEHLGPFVAHASNIGLKTSIITNGTRLTPSWLDRYAPYINQIGVSCDSLDDRVNAYLGRGFGNHVKVTTRALRRIRAAPADIKIKLNTVVMRHTCAEDWSAFVTDNAIDRWKVFKVLRIVGENDAVFDAERLGVTDAEFAKFVARHAHLSQLVPETNDDMTNSYIMITPDGRFYQNAGGRYSYSDDIVAAGVGNALASVGFDIDKFVARGGAYAL